jgi:hypothetical protein
MLRDKAELHIDSSSLLGLDAFSEPQACRDQVLKLLSWFGDAERLSR